MLTNFSIEESVYLLIILSSSETERSDFWISFKSLASFMELLSIKLALNILFKTLLGLNHGAA